MHVVPLLTSATTMSISDNATEVPEARFTAITPEASYTWSAGALPCGWVTSATIGAVWVAMAGAYKRKKHWSLELHSPARPVRAGFKYSLGQPAKPTPWAAVTLSWQQP